MPTWKMELPTMPNNLSLEKRVELLQSSVEELLNRFAWFTSKLDSKNVKRLDTNETVIKSADGTTEIVGPVLVQKDSGGTTRLRQGYDAATGDFIYELFSAAGAETVSLDSNGYATFQNETGGVFIDETGLGVYNGNFRMYDDEGLTAIIDGGTFYGDNFVVTSNIWVGEDIYMNADYITSQMRRIYPFQNDNTIYVSMAPGGTGVDPTCQFIGFNEVYCENNLSCGGSFDAFEAYENGDRLATRDWVSANFQPL